MGRLSNLKDKVSSTVSEAKQRVSEAQAESAADDGEIDQLEARKERARLEARREAQKEQRQKEIEQTRETAKEAVRNNSDENAGILEQAVTAVGSVADDIDIDGDGEPLAAELDDPAGGQPAGGQEMPGMSGGVAVEEDLLALEQTVSENEREIDALEDEVFGGDGSRPDRGGGGGADDPLGTSFDAAAQLGYDDDNGAL